MVERTVGAWVACPGSVVVKAGKQFTCTYLSGVNQQAATVDIENDDGQLAITTGG